LKANQPVSSGGDYKGSLHFYDEALELSANNTNQQIDETNQTIAVLNNRALAHLQLQNYDGCIRDTSTVLKICIELKNLHSKDPASNVKLSQLQTYQFKALIRRADAYLRLGLRDDSLNHLKLAKKDIDAVVFLDEANHTQINLLKSSIESALEKAQKQQQEIDKARANSKPIQIVEFDSSETASATEEHSQATSDIKTTATTTLLFPPTPPSNTTVSTTSSAEDKKSLPPTPVTPNVVIKNEEKTLETATPIKKPSATKKLKTPDISQLKVDLPTAPAKNSYE
jgi:tetratricopeptide (TPR) repeat protein